MSVDLDFLPKPLVKVFKALSAVIAIVLATMFASTWLDQLVVTKATAAAKDSVQGLREDVSAIRQDSRFTRCALIVHMTKGDEADLLKCDEQK